METVLFVSLNFISVQSFSGNYIEDDCRYLSQQMFVGDLIYLIMIRETLIFHNICQMLPDFLRSIAFRKVARLPSFVLLERET
jgi:hypothetical protein